MSPELPPARAKREFPLVSPAKILIVDDEPSVRRYVRRILEHEGRAAQPAFVREAASVEDAVRCLEGDAFDLVILDIGFPGRLQGSHLLERLRSRQAAVPVLVLSGNIEERSFAELYRLGAVEVLLKPVAEDALRITVFRVIRAARAARSADWDEAVTRVLHVEDDPEWAALVGLWMVQAGHVVRNASSRAELLTFLRCTRALPDCIVLDLTLPDADGLALCGELKGRLEFRVIPLVVFSARGDARLAALKKRAVSLVLKPDGCGRADELVATVGSVIDQLEAVMGVVKKGGLRLDPRGFRVFHHGRRVAELKPTHYEMLRLLVEAAPGPVTRDALRACLPRGPYLRSHPEDPAPDTVGVYISRIRNCLGADSGVRIVADGLGGYALGLRTSAGRS